MFCDFVEMVWGKSGSTEGSTRVSSPPRPLRVGHGILRKSRATERVPTLLRTPPAPTGCTWYTQNTLLIVQQQELYGEDRRQTPLARSPSIRLRWAHGLVWRRRR